MWFRLMIIVGMISVGYASNLLAQDEGDFITTYNVYYFYDHEVFTEFYDDFFRRLKDNLAEHNISLSIVERNADVPTSMGIEFWTNFDGERIAQSVQVALYPLVSPLGELSSLLYTDLSTSWPGFAFSTSVEESANIATALVLYTLGRCDIAESGLSEVKQKRIEDINLAYVNFYLGNCALLRGDYEGAILLFENAISSSTYNYYHGAIVNLAWAYLQVGREEEVFELIGESIDYYKAEEYKERLRKALIDRAQLYALAFRYDDALTDMDAAIELDPTNPELYVLRGQITLYLYEWDRVLADYNRAIELAPDYADAYYYRGILFYTQGYREDALADFQHYLDLAPDGDHAADAEQYIANIEQELEALN